MKIVVLGSYAESLLLFRGHLLKAIVQLGHRVIACAPEQHPRVQAVLEGMGIPYQPLRFERTGINFIYDLITIVRLWRFFRRERPDVLLSYTVKPVIYGSLAARLCGVHHVFSMITGLGYAFSGDGARQVLLRRAICLLYRVALASNQVVFFQNPDDLALFRQLGIVGATQRTVVLNGSGVDLESFHETPFPKGSKVFLLIARLLKDKGILEYVEAARELRGRHPDVVFHLIGPVDSNPSAIALKLVHQWEEEGIICYHGAVSDVRPFLAAASVYVLPSYREGTPRTSLEAMAMGRPIVTTDVPGCRETVIEGQNGFLVPPRNAHALARAMERFIVEPDLLMAMGRRSREIAVERFDVQKVNQVILQAMGLLARESA